MLLLTSLYFSEILWVVRILTPPFLYHKMKHETCTVPSPTSSQAPGSTHCRVWAPGSVEKEDWRKAPASGSWGAVPSIDLPPPVRPARSGSPLTTLMPRWRFPPLPLPAPLVIAEGRLYSSQPGEVQLKITCARTVIHPAAAGEKLLIRSSRRSRDAIKGTQVTCTGHQGQLFIHREQQLQHFTLFIQMIFPIKVRPGPHRPNQQRSPRGGNEGPQDLSEHSCLHLETC